MRVNVAEETPEEKAKLKSLGGASSFTPVESQLGSLNETSQAPAQQSYLDQLLRAISAKRVAAQQKGGRSRIATAAAPYLKQQR